MSCRSVEAVIEDGSRCARITGNWSSSWMGEHPVAQVWIEIEENDNCGYHPLQTFEQQGEPTSYSSVVVEDVAGAEGPHEVVGWTTEDGGGPCDVTVILIGDSGSGQSILVHGGDAGGGTDKSSLYGPVRGAGVSRASPSQG